ncbi:3-deoxy-D-arabinoheptulosonate-7-phosphate synthase [Desulfitobacterium chlororespirans DSM 11544]|uniref:3-deoxy-D-arabinoheptulosonate-7-phosphate synthase n=2 Tax=Desulfitobacterium chlororespirans TaxID=51616 RepID=A0A1M7T0E8_9FIRM|nr:3-deoxy-D-arabinoheptulosonate-7-phosphate synthase [Desulfitobacterium chlororespirans DSM 11544]
MNLPLVGLKDERSMIRVGDTIIGAREIVLMAGPCAVESGEQMRAAAQGVKAAGGKILRGGVYKPRTSPYSFQGLGEEGIDYLREAAAEYGLLTVTEVMDERSLDVLVDKVDILQVGSRNMQNFHLLKLLGEIRNPVILKRGLAATVEEWLSAAEYILSGGNAQVILCERGIRTFEPSTRNTLDLSAVSLVKVLSHLPVIVDPSHAAGRVDIIPALAKAAVAVGADGLLIEVHPHPEEAQSDGMQSLTPEQFSRLAAELRPIAQSVGRSMAHPQEV